MRFNIVAFSLLALAASGYEGGLAAKEPTRKLIVSGGGLAGGVEIVDSATLALSDIYSGNFLGAPGAVVAPAPTAPRYEISFFLPERRSWLYDIVHRPRLEVAYTVYFVPDADHRSGYVYVPGRGDTWTDWNHGTIIRDGYEGRWSPASPEWAERINRALARHRRVAAPRCPSRDSAALIKPGDPRYADVSSLTAFLKNGGMDVLCAYITTFDGTLGRPAAGITTSLGSFGVLFFPSPADAERVSITSRIVDGHPVTVLRSPDPHQRPVTMDGADKTDYLAYKRWLFDTWGQLELRAALAAALANHQPFRPTPS